MFKYIYRIKFLSGFFKGIFIMEFKNKFFAVVYKQISNNLTKPICPASNIIEAIEQFEKEFNPLTSEEKFEIVNFYYLMKIKNCVEGEKFIKWFDNYDIYFHFDPETKFNNIKNLFDL